MGIVKKISFITILLVLISFSLARAEVLNFSTNLTGSNEVPPVITSATGTSTLNINDSHTQGSITLNVQNADGLTAAHLHCAPVGVNGPVVVGLFSSSTSTGISLSGQLASTTITNANIEASANTCVTPIGNMADLVTALQKREIYVNVHSTSSPSGLIRGQLINTPIATSTSPTTTIVTPTPTPSPTPANLSSGQRFIGQPDPHILLSVYFRLPNQNFSVTGRGYGVNENVQVSFAGQTIQTTTNSSGEFTTSSFTVPYGVINSTQNVSAQGQSSGINRSASIVIGSFYPFVSPSSYFVLPGQSFSFSGIRFAPNEQVTMSGGGQSTANFTADGAGNFSTGSFTAGSPGNQVFTFRGNSSGLQTTATVIIGVPW